MRRVRTKIGKLFSDSSSSTKGDRLSWAALLPSSAAAPSRSEDKAVDGIVNLSGTSTVLCSDRASHSNSGTSSVAHGPTHERKPQALGLLDAHCAMSPAEIATEISPIPVIGLLMGDLTCVFWAVERSRVNREQWRLLQGRCVAVVRIAAAQVVENGRENYPELEEAAHTLEQALNKIQQVAQHYNQMDDIVVFLLYQTISDGIKSLFDDLDACHDLFSSATDVEQGQWAEEFRIVRERELKDIQYLRSELEKMNVDMDSTCQSTEKMLVKTQQISTALQQVLKDKTPILQAQGTIPAAIFTDAQRIIRIILSVTKLQLPPILLGEQCGLKVAKKVLRIGMSDQAYVEKFAKQLLRIMIMDSWPEVRSDYILPCYGIGIELFEGDKHFQMYMVLPFMKNFDAMTYLRPHRGSRGIKKYILKIVTDAAIGLEYLHSLHPPLVHGGMQGSNILISDSGGGVLSGFGLTRAQKSTEDITRLGSRCEKTEFQRWRAPEMFDDNPPLATPSDVWEWAMATLEVVSGLVPYRKHKKSMTIMLQILKGPPIREDYPSFNDYAFRPDEMWTLLEKCWAQDPSNRPTMVEVVKELREIAKMEEWDA